jgi:hypothetical protein
MPYILENDRKPFDVRDCLDRPDVIEAYIGDLKVEIERLHAVLKEIAAIADRLLADNPPSN